MKEMNVFYKELDGKYYLTLLAKQEGNVLKTVECPFCGEVHTHGLGDGHRVAHCKKKESLEGIRTREGAILLAKDGYIVRNASVPGTAMEVIQETPSRVLSVKQMLEISKMRDIEDPSWKLVFVDEGGMVSTWTQVCPEEDLPSVIRECQEHAFHRDRPLTEITSISKVSPDGKGGLDFNTEEEIDPEPYQKHLKGKHEAI